jgi:alpha-beta hydrolase superfamily lysophospholipase
MTILVVECVVRADAERCSEDATKAPERSAAEPPTLEDSPDRFLAEQPVAIRDREVGRGPAVLLHGYSDQLDMWSTVANALAREMRVVASDLRSFGDSGRLADPALAGPVGASPPDRSEPQWMENPAAQYPPAAAKLARDRSARTFLPKPGPYASVLQSGMGKT